jgi:hypothetical protein
MQKTLLFLHEKKNVTDNLEISRYTYFIDCIFLMFDRNKSLLVKLFEMLI